MKIRNGFVSNSSSASFILTLTDITQEDFLKELKHYMSFDLKEELESLLTEHEQKTAQIKTNHNIFLQRRLEIVYMEYKELIEFDKYEDQGEELFLWWLNHRHFITIKDVFNGIELEYFTSMYNGTEDISSLLKDFLCYFMVHHPKKLFLCV